MTPLFNRKAIYVSLVLALALVVGVLFGAKYFLSTVAKQPVSVAEIPAPQADSPECAALVEALPDRLMGHSRSDIIEPVPAGTAAWATLSSEATTLRCGVELPLQFTALSQVHDVEGTNWVQIRDVAPGSTMSTWYTTNREPVVALTTWDEGEPTDLSEALETLPLEEHEPHPLPLSDLPPADNASQACQALEQALPEKIGDNYTPVDNAELASAPEYYRAWVAEDRDPVTIRCGVEPPAGYEPGAQLQQIDDVPWFQDNSAATGATSSAWYALGRDTDIAVSLPLNAAEEVLPVLTRAIEENTGEQD